MSKVIPPSVGRKVWYRPSKFDLQGPKPMIVVKDQPLDATVIAVWSDRCINVLVTDIVGNQFPVLSCTLIQEGDHLPEDSDGNVVGRYAQWMPCQVGQAKKEGV